MAQKQLSLRAIVKELEITPAYLSMMVNGKRPWRKDLYEQYSGLVNTVNRNGEMENTMDGVVGGIRFELMTSAMSTQRSRPLS